MHMDRTTRNILIVIAVIVVIVLALPAAVLAFLLPISVTSGPGMPLIGPMDGQFFGALGGRGIAIVITIIAVMALFWIAVIVGIVLLVRWAARSAGGAAPSHREEALEILRRRYAAGEIDKEEYEQKKKDITGT